MDINDWLWFLVVEAPTTSAAVAAPSGPAYSYDDLFPALPESATPKFTAPAWKRIGSSVVTQVRSFVWVESFEVTF